jgi:glycosyltransferase involved in cell wall biosynthesis
MSEPLLTIGIPHKDRSNFLGRAIESCLRQTMPARIIVADQGHTDETAEVMDRYADNPLVMHLPTEATNLWQNWEAVARACDTPFFAWCQDDDIVAPAVKRGDGSLVPGTGFVHRVLAAFDQFPDALHWQGRLYCAIAPPDGSIDDLMATPWGQSFPWVHMPMLAQKPLQWPGEILPPASYLTSWGMSPGVAFRCGEAFDKALAYMPADCALMHERLILASMGIQGPWIADPMVAGYWVHHGRNESFGQHVDQERQTQVMIEHLDECMDVIDWQDVFEEWCKTMNPAQVLGFLNDFQCKASRHAEDLQLAMARSLKGRVEAAECPVHLRDEVRGSDLASLDEALVWN